MNESYLIYVMVITKNTTSCAQQDSDKPLSQQPQYIELGVGSIKAD